MRFLERLLRPAGGFCVAFCQRGGADLLFVSDARLRFCPQLGYSRSSSGCVLESLRQKHSRYSQAGCLSSFPMVRVVEVTVWTAQDFMHKAGLLNWNAYLEK
eukprot:3296165-Rhodomonas_salina.2